MRSDVPRQWVQRLAAAPEEYQRRFIAKMSPSDLLHWDAMFECWSVDGQIEPTGEGWTTWLMMAGRGFGKTRAGAEWITGLAQCGRRQIALVGATIDEARSIMVEGVSGLLGIARRKRVKVKWEPGAKRLTWPRGSVAELFSGESPDGLRGPEHDYAWCACADRLAACRLGRGRTACRAAADPGDRPLLSRRIGQRERSLRRP